MHFQNIQDRHKLCIFDITLFAYDFLLEQQENSHEEYLVNKRTPNQGAQHDHGPIIWGSPIKIRRISQRKIAWGKSPPESLGAFQQQIWPDQTPSGGTTKHI